MTETIQFLLLVFDYLIVNDKITFNSLLLRYCLNDGRTDGLQLNYKDVMMLKRLDFDNNQGVYFA